MPLMPFHVLHIWGENSFGPVNTALNANHSWAGAYKRLRAISYREGCKAHGIELMKVRVRTDCLLM